MDPLEQETNLKCDTKRQGHRQCSTLEGQNDYYGNIIQKSKGVKKNLWGKKEFRRVNEFKGRGGKNI